MRLGDEFFDTCNSFNGYRITLIRKDNYKPAVFNLFEEEFEQKKELIILLDFLVKTDQWIPYAVYQDLFDLPEDNYPGLRLIKEVQINYIEYSLRIKNVKIY